MMKSKTVIVLLFFSTLSFAQVSEWSGVYFAKDFSKEIALYRAKSFLMDQVLEQNDDITKFELDPLAAASSGELTSLVYRIPDGKNGLILGFYGDRWNDSGVIYQAYGFKSLIESEAKEFFERIDSVIEEHEKYLGDDSGVNNLYFQFEDMTILMYQENRATRMRVFWKGFDSEWESTAYKRTNRRFKKKV